VNGPPARGTEQKVLNGEPQSETMVIECDNGVAYDVAVKPHVHAPASAAAALTRSAEVHTVGVNGRGG
jgi:hypothetical protein